MGSSMSSIRGMPTVNQSIQVGGMVLGGQGVLCMGCFGLFMTLGGIMALVTATTFIPNDFDHSYADPSLIAGAVLIGLGVVLLVISGVLACMIKRHYRTMKEPLTGVPGFSGDLRQQYTTYPSGVCYGSNLDVAASFPAHRLGSVSTAGRPSLPQGYIPTASAPPPQQAYMPSPGYPQGDNLGFGSAASYMPNIQGYDPPLQYSLHTQPQDSTALPPHSPEAWSSMPIPVHIDGGAPPPPSGVLPPYNPMVENPYDPSGGDPMLLPRSNKADEFTMAAGEDTSISAPLSNPSPNFPNP